MRLINLIARTIGAFVLLALSVGCSEDTTEASSTAQYGFVQFKLAKNGTPEAAASSSRASDADRLDSLADAKKIKVTLKTDDTTVEQTLLLSAANGTETERGLWSEKLQLMSGTYRIMGYELLDNMDRTILTSDIEDAEPFEVISGGLIVREVSVNVVPRGLVKFQMVKDLSLVDTRAADSYRFENVVKADITVEHENSGEIRKFVGIRTKVEYYYEDDQTAYTHSRIVCDTVVALKAGNYRVASFIVYDRSKKILEAATQLAENKFVVIDNQTTVADVPITLQPSAGHIRDGIALKTIWDALDGPNWSYRGRSFPEGSNWDFDRDIDLWTAQPGVKVHENGRVASLSLGGFGARGAMPDALGELTEMRNLMLGTHDESFSDSPINDVDPEQVVETLRKSFKQMAAPDCSLIAMAPEMRQGFPDQMQARIKASESRGNRTSEGLDAYANDPNNYSSAITSLPKTIGNLKNLKTLFIASNLIKDLPEEVKYLEKCTDLSIFNCRHMTEMPAAMMEMPTLQMIYFANNRSISSEKLYEGLQKMTEKPIAKTVQGLYFMNNNLVHVPDLRPCEKLGFIDFQNNKIESFDAPFGKEHNLGTLNLKMNRLSSLPTDDEGYFAGFEAVEEWSFSGNQFTELPDIFDAQSAFLMGTVDFSANQISSIQNADNGTYRGVNVEIFNLSFNRLPKFPKCIYNSNSKINYLIVRGNGMREFEKDALKGDYTFITQSLDLAQNRLSELPAEFNNRTFGYMVGLDLTSNAFSSFAWRAMDLSNLTILLFRSQRDDRGYRCMREWPISIFRHHALQVIYLGSNDIRQVNDGTLERLRIDMELTDNPNLSIDLTPLCPYITAGLVSFLFDPGQDVRGCEAARPKN